MQKTFKTTIQAVILVAVTAVFSLAGPSAQPDSSPSAAEIKASLDKVPNAVFPQLKFEFGSVYEGTEIKHDFVVENTGEAPLVIKNIRPD
jgi:hypothetical protein